MKHVHMQKTEHRMRAPPPTLPPMMPFTPVEVGTVVVDNTIAEVGPMVTYGIAAEVIMVFYMDVKNEQYFLFF